MNIEYSKLTELKNLVFDSFYADCGYKRRQGVCKLEESIQWYMYIADSMLGFMTIEETRIEELKKFLSTRFNAKGNRWKHLFKDYSPCCLDKDHLETIYPLEEDSLWKLTTRLDWEGNYKLETLYRETPIIVESAVPSSHPMEMGEGTSGNLTSQISPNFRFRSERIDLERVTECTQRTPTRPVIDSDSQRTPPSSGNKARNLFAISPVKTTSRKRTNTEAVKTLVFCDFETSGLFTAGNEPKKNYNLRKSRCPSEFASELEKFCMDTQKDNYPRILELSFVAVARETFEKSIKQMDLKNQPGACSLRVRVPCNIHTRQINPKMSDTEWAQYDRVRSINPVALVHEKNDLHLKNSFDVEWKQVRKFLDSCPKPACLVAHNGLYFDYRLIYGELSRYGLLKSQALPDGILFVDSLLAFQNIEDSLKLRLEQTLKAIDWNLISRLSLLEEVVPSEVPERPNDHPLNFLDKSEWPTAFFKRSSPTDFKKTSSGKWEFAPSGRKYNLKNLYETTIGGGFDFHYAQDDSEGLLQICLAYGKEFLVYLDSSAAEIPF